MGEGPGALAGEGLEALTVVLVAVVFATAVVLTAAVENESQVRSHSTEERRGRQKEEGKRKSNSGSQFWITVAFAARRILSRRESRPIDQTNHVRFEVGESDKKGNNW